MQASCPADSVRSALARLLPRESLTARSSSPRRRRRRRYSQSIRSANQANKQMSKQASKQALDSADLGNSGALVMAVGLPQSCHSLAESFSPAPESHGLCASSSSAFRVPGTQVFPRASSRVLTCKALPQTLGPPSRFPLLPRSLQFLARQQQPEALARWLAGRLGVSLRRACRTRDRRRGCQPGPFASRWRFSRSRWLGLTD